MDVDPGSSTKDDDNDSLVVVVELVLSSTPPRSLHVTRDKYGPTTNPVDGLDDDDFPRETAAIKSERGLLIVGDWRSPKRFLPVGTRLMDFVETSV